MSDVGVLVDLTTRLVRPPIAWSDDPSTGPALVFDPPLTPDEATTFGQLQAMVALGLDADVDQASLARLWPQVQACLGFLNDPTPTNAEALAALKALIRVVRFMFLAGARA